MKFLKREGLRGSTRITKSKAEIKAISDKKQRFEEEMSEVRAESIAKSSRSCLSAAQILLNG